MKKYYIICVALLSLSSCLKIEDANLCPNAPPAPRLASTTVQVAQNYALSVSVLSPDPSLVYNWISPDGADFSGSSLYDTYANQYGVWSLIAKSSGSCISDTTKFNVTPVIPGCGMGLDSFLLAGSPAFKLNFINSNNSYFNGYYQIAFEDNQYGVLSFYFLNFPADGVYYVTSNSYTNLSGNQCYIYYSGGYQFTAYTGTITVVVTGASVAIYFCNTGFVNSYSGQNIDGSGYFIGS